MFPPALGLELFLTNDYDECVFNKKRRIAMANKLKTLLWSLAVLAIGCFLFSPHMAFADGVVDPPPGMGWLPAVIAFLSSIPKVGPIIVIVIKWVGAIAGIATALSICVQAVLKVPELVAHWAGASALAEKIRAISDKILPWLQYLSILNVQKK